MICPSLTLHLLQEMVASMTATIPDPLSFHLLSLSSTRFVNFSLWEVSVLELWKMFGETVTGLFEEERGLELYPAEEYVKFAFKVRITLQSLDLWFTRDNPRTVRICG